VNIEDAVKTYNVAKQAGFAGSALYVITAIAGAESSFNPLAIGDVSLQDEKWGPSVGLWQIRSLKNPLAFPYPDNLRDATKLKDPLYNAQAAFAISKKGTDFTPWSTFTNKAYQEFTGIIDQVNELAATAAKPLSLIEMILFVIIAMKIFGGSKKVKAAH